jgi:hypothetical protein
MTEIFGSGLRVVLIPIGYNIETRRIIFNGLNCASYFKIKTVEVEQ